MRERMFLLLFFKVRSLHTLVFGSIAFKLYDLGQMFWVSFHKLLTREALLELWPIPPDRTGLTESGL